MWLCCPPGRKTLRPVFSRRGSDANWVCYVHKVCPLCQLSNQDTIFHVNFFYTVVAKCNNKYATYQRILHQLLHFDKPQSVDAFCTKNFSLMQNASTLPTHFVTKKSKCTNCYIGAKCVVSHPVCAFIFGSVVSI